jgi:hypothetical protein
MLLRPLEVACNQPLDALKQLTKLCRLSFDHLGGMTNMTRLLVPAIVRRTDDRRHTWTPRFAKHFLSVLNHRERLQPYIRPRCAA